MDRHRRLNATVAAVAFGLAVLIGVAALEGPGAPSHARADKDSYKQFQKFISSPNSWDRQTAVRVLDANDKKELKALLKVLQTQEWHVRTTAIEVLGGAFDEKLVKTLEKELTRGRDAMIAEGIALAFGKKGDKAHLPALYEALEDKKWPVRRSAAYALGLMPDEKSVGPLIKAWKDEKEVIVGIRIAQSLEKITGQFLGPNPTDWENWWIGAEADFKVGQRDEEAEKLAEEKGFKAKEVVTVERGVEINYKTRGNGPPLFVLPEYGYNRSYLEHYLRPLEEFAKIFYIDLPAPSKIQGVEMGPGGSPIYPVDKLCDAFEEIRKKEFEKAKASKDENTRKNARERIVILGHCISSWIAMRYATKYPQSLAGMVLVAPFSGNQAYGNALTRLEGLGKERGDLELEHYAQSLQIIDQAGTHKYELRDKTPEEQTAIGHYKRWTLYFADPRDSGLTIQFFGGLDMSKGPNSPDSVNRPDVGSAIVPQFDVYKEAKAPTPTVVFVGKYSEFTTVQDCQKIVKHYPNAQMIVMPKSSRMPFIEENTNFVKKMTKLLK